MLVLIGDEFYGRKAANILGIAYRDVSAVADDDEHIAVVTSVEDLEHIRQSLAGRTEVAVIICAQDCRPFVRLADMVRLLFAGIPRKDRFIAAIEDSTIRDEYMASERNKINTARSIENLVAARGGMR